MEIKEKVLQEILSFYVKSKDFNGIPLSALQIKMKEDPSEIIEIVKILVEEDKVTIQTGTNPHIISLGSYTFAHQLQKLEEAKQNETKIILKIKGGPDFVSQSHPVCLYPTENLLRQKRNVDEYAESPFTKRLALGEPQLKPIYFDVEVLDRYLKDPRFSFDFEDYSGKISYHETEEKASELREEDKFFMQTFGLGTDEKGGRVAVVYLRYLSDLTPEHQVYWKSKIRKDNCQILKEYYDNTIVGTWTTSYSIFKAFIGQQKLLNEISEAIFGVPLFRKTFEDDKRPKEFTFFMTPTLENYNSFILLLDKMYSENINKTFFEGKIDTWEFLPVSDGVVERKGKGTIVLLQAFVEKNYKAADKKPLDEVFGPIKEIRRERQDPAHRINENFYDKVFVEKQKQMMIKALHSITALRYIFQAHPKAAHIKIPKWLETGSIKIF
ncbi:hypothetical protein FA048_12830 [Pedobacter polaris]|uniref:Uncharacterized protein n=1 Tax=Pedobacter polaris TaxID=2571273 RepID=A0A4U1CQQ8_9SPHI|nr:hypothetical protein [Pedobacter polaris]TKC08042.1 hypothetical protein FA048_12830 [Pedobacter polaris]